jgi:hypothetical protein
LLSDPGDVILDEDSLLIVSDIYLFPNTTLTSYGASILGNVHNNGTFKTNRGTTINGDFIQSRIATVEALELIDDRTPLISVRNANIDGRFHYSSNVTHGAQAKFLVLKSQTNVNGHFQQIFAKGSVPINSKLEYTYHEVYLTLNVRHRSTWWVWIVAGMSIMLSMVSLFSICIWYKYGHRDGFRRV